MASALRAGLAWSRTDIVALSGGSPLGCLWLVADGDNDDCRGWLKGQERWIRAQTQYTSQMVAELAIDHAAELGDDRRETARAKAERAAEFDRPKMKAEALACRAAGMVRVTLKIETGEDTLKELEMQIKVSQRTCAETKESLRGAEASDEMAAGVLRWTDPVVDIDARIRATVAHENDVALSSFLKSAVMKFNPDPGESAFVKSVHGGMKDSCDPRKSEYLSSRERARVIPARQPGRSEIETSKARSSEFERSH